MHEDVNPKPRVAGARACPEQAKRAEGDLARSVSKFAVHTPRARFLTRLKFAEFRNDADTRGMGRNLCAVLFRLSAEC